MNKDSKTVDGFGDEWTRFDQSSLDDLELNNLYQTYFSIFPWDRINTESVGFDMGCGSGRWAKLVAPKVKLLYCVDPSNAISIAKKNLFTSNNCIFLNEEVSHNSLPDNSMDFGYSLGVLHHIPDTQKGINDCVKKLKPGAPFLIYLYYKFDNRNIMFRSLWSVSNALRYLISRMPYFLRFICSQIIAFTIYLPLARLSRVLSKLGFSDKSLDGFPLSFYKDKSLYTMRTDALDRFGTQLEKRFTKKEIEEMLVISGLTDIKFSDNRPYWVATGIKK